MAWGLIVAVVAVCSVIVALLWSVSRSMEAARERKRQRIHALQRRIISFLDLIDGIPPAYLGAAMRQFALEQVLACAQEILQLDPGDTRASRQVSEAQTALATAASEPPPVRISTQLEANNIRKSLIETARFLQSLHTQGLLEASKARPLLNAVKANATRVQIDALLLKANEARQQDKSASAVLLYQRALDELRKHPSYPRKEETIARIEETMVELGKTNSAFDKPQVTSAAPSALTRALEADLAEEDQWKKKSF